MNSKHLAEKIINTIKDHSKQGTFGDNYTEACDELFSTYFEDMVEDVKEAIESDRKSNAVCIVCGGSTPGIRRFCLCNQ